MFQSGGGGRVEESSISSAPVSDAAPQAATVVRTESHLARFNTARALFEKMGQGDAAPPRRASATPGIAVARSTPTPTTAPTPVPAFKKPDISTRQEAKVVSRLQTKIEGPGTGDGVRRSLGLGERVRGESVSPARSSNTSSRSPSPGAPRTANGHAPHNNTVGLRRPGSTSSTDSDPPRRWPPTRISDPCSAPESTHQDQDSNLGSRWPQEHFSGEDEGSGPGRGRGRSDAPVKLGGVMERQASPHDQHKELLARHKNWFQSFSKNRTTAPSPTRAEGGPTLNLGPPSPNKVETCIVSPNKTDAPPPSPTKSDWRTNYSSNTDLKSPRGGGEGCEGTENSKQPPGAGGSNEQEAWSSVLQNRYGHRARQDLLPTRTRGNEGETCSDWRRERAAILAGRSGQRQSGSEDEVKGQFRSQQQGGVTCASRFEDAATLQSHWVPPQQYGVSEGDKVESQSETSSTTTTSRENQSEGYTSSRKSQSDCSIASSHDNQSEPEEPPGTKTLKDVNNVAQTERLKTSRGGVTENGFSTSGVRENGSSRSVVLGETCEKRSSMVVSVEKKEETDLIVTESVVLKDSVKEKDIEHFKSDYKSDSAIRDSDKEKDLENKAESIARSDLSDLYSSDRRKIGKSKETSEVVNARLKETILGDSEVTSEKRDYRKELEERRIRREERVERRKEELLQEGRRRREREWRGVKGKYGETRERESSEESEARRRDEGRGRVRTRESSEEEVRDGSEERVRPLRRNRDTRVRDRRSEEREVKSEEKSNESEEKEKVKESEEKERIKESEEKERIKEIEEKERIKEIGDKQRVIENEDILQTPTPPTPESAADVVVAGVVSVLKAETVYVSSTEDLSLQEDSSKRELKIASPEARKEVKVTSPEVRKDVKVESPEGKIKEDQDIKEKEEKEEGDVDTTAVRRQLFPDVVAECAEADSGTNREEEAEIHLPEADFKRTHREELNASLLPDYVRANQEEASETQLPEADRPIMRAKREEHNESHLPEADLRRFSQSDIRETDLLDDSQDDDSQARDRSDATDTQAPSDPISQEEEVKVTPPTSPRAQSLAALDALIHGDHAHPPAKHAHQEEDEIMYDHTVRSAQHEIQFCTTPVTVEGFPDGRREETSSHDSDPEPLPPPIPPHGVDPATINDVIPPPADSTSYHAINNNFMVGRGDSVSPAADNNNILRDVSPLPILPPTADPDVMTPDEAQRLLSAKEGHGVLSDEEAQEVVLLLSPQSDITSTTTTLPAPCLPTHPTIQEEGQEAKYDSEHAFDSGFASETVTKYDPSAALDPTNRFDTSFGSYNPNMAYDPADKYNAGATYDPTLTSPLSPEDEPSEADSSEASGDPSQVTRVKEVLVEDGVHYLEDGHFWVEVPGLADDWDDEDEDPNLPFHPHTKLTFSTRPVQVFSTYSVTEYDRKNDDVDPVAASAEYELEKRVEKMDLFPVQILKGDGGLGLSIIGMGVGADAGVEKLGIFVKTITPGGATESDGRIQVNDQIIEVDGKSLVGVTQVFAASVLKNTSGEVQFLIGREKDPDNSEVALLIKQSLMADMERDERRRALGGPDYDPHTGQAIFDPLSSPSEENSRSEDGHPHHHHHHHPHHYPHYMGSGQSPPTSPDGASPTPEVFDLEGDTSDTSPEGDVASLRKKLKEIQYRNAVAEAEAAKLKMALVEMERKLGEGWAEGQGQLQEAVNRAAELDSRLNAKMAEAATYQDMLEQSQGQFIVLEKKYYKAKKIIKEYQGRERDFLHREEYHITQLEDKDSHYNALVKALKDRVIQLEGDLVTVQKTAGLPVQVPQTDSSHWQQPPQPHSATKVPVKEELDEAVPPHELLDVSASRAKGELAARGGLANRHLPSLKKTTSMSSQSSQDHSLDDSSLDDELPEALKQQQQQQQQQQQELSSRPECQQDSRREVESEGTGGSGAGGRGLERDVSPSKRSPTSLIEDVRQAVMQADVSSLHHHHQHLSSSSSSSTHNITTTTTTTTAGSTAISPQRAPSAFYSPAGRESLRERDRSRESGTGGTIPSPKLTRSSSTPHHSSSSSHHSSSIHHSSSTHHTSSSHHSSSTQHHSSGSIHHSSSAAVSPNPSGVVLLSQRSLDSSHKQAPGLGEGGGGSSGDLSSGPASLGSGDEGSGASLGGSQTSLTPPDRSRRAHMWQTAPVVDWSKEQVSQWLMVQGLEGCVGRFLEVGMTGPRLLNLDLRDLKSLHLPPDDRTRLKRKVKDLRLAVEKERKQAEKEKKERERLQKKAEKLAEKAERKKK